jgi:hypothetical protein
MKSSAHSAFIEEKDSTSYKHGRRKPMNFKVGNESAANAATNMSLTSLVAAVRHNRIPRTFTYPS